MVRGAHKSMLNKSGGTELFTKLANIIESGISSPFDCALLAYLRGESVLICQGRGGGDASETDEELCQSGRHMHLPWRIGT